MPPDNGAGVDRRPGAGPAARRGLPMDSPTTSTATAAPGPAEVYDSLFVPALFAPFARAVADAAELTLGAAHVAILTGPASFHLTDRMGRELSVFRQAVRIYRPGFSRWKDQPARHPLFLPARVDAWRVEGWVEEGRPAFMGWLADQVLASSVHRADRDEELPPFNSVRLIAAQAERVCSSSSR